MNWFITHWLLIFALLTQTISQDVAAFYAPNHRASAQFEANVADSAQDFVLAEQPHATENSHCHDAIEAGRAQLPTDENDAPICPCCDDDCSMPRCQSVAMLVDMQFNFFFAPGCAAPTAQPAARWLLRSRAPPTPPPDVIRARV